MDFTDDEESAAGIGTWLARLFLTGLAVLFVTGGLGIGALYYFNHRLDDAQRGQWASAAMTRFLPGSFRIGALGGALPDAIEIHDVNVDSPFGMRVIRAEHVGAQLRVTELLRLHVALYNVQVDSAEVNVRQDTPTSPVDIAATFDARELHKLPPGDEVEASQTSALRIDIDHIVVNNAVVNVQVPDVKLNIRDIAVSMGSLWIQGNTLGISVQAQCDIALAAGDINLAVPKLRITAKEADYRFALNNKHVAIKSINLATLGLTVDANGEVDATEKAIQGVHVSTAIQLDTRLRMLQARLPSDFAKTLRGNLIARLKLDGAGDNEHFLLDLTGNRLAVRHVNLDSIHAEGAFKASQLTVDTLKIAINGATIEGKGSLTLAPKAGTAVGRHDLQVSTQAFPLREIFGPFVNQAGLIPERVSLDMHTKGASLWPMGAEVDLKAVATGVPGYHLRALPDPFVVHGKVFTHPTDIEITRLHLGSEDSQLGLAGRVPLKPDGIMDIVNGVHLLKEKN